MARTALAIVIVIGALAFAGYSLYREYTAAKNIEVEIVDVSINRIGLTSADLSFKLKFANPTGYETPVFWIDSYSIYINNRYVGTGSLPATKIPANSKIYEQTTITLEYTKVGEGVASAIEAGKFTLTVEGVINARILFGTIPVSVQFSATYEYK